MGFEMWIEDRDYLSPNDKGIDTFYWCKFFGLHYFILEHLDSKPINNDSEYEITNNTSFSIGTDLIRCQLFIQKTLSEFIPDSATKFDYDEYYEKQTKHNSGLPYVPDFREYVFNEISSYLSKKLNRYSMTWDECETYIEENITDDELDKLDIEFNGSFDGPMGSQIGTFDWIVGILEATLCFHWLTLFWNESSRYFYCFSY